MAMCLSVCLCLPQVGSSIKTAKWIELIFDMDVSFHLTYTVFYGNLGNSKNKGTSFWDFVPNSGLFATASRQVGGGQVLSINTLTLEVY